MNLRRSLCLGLALTMGAAGSMAIDLERTAPKKPLAGESKAVDAPSPPPRVVEAKGDASIPAGPVLKGIVIVKSRDEVKASGDLSVTGVKIGAGESLDLLRGEDFSYLMESFIGERVSEANIKNVQREIILYYRSRGRSVVDVVVPQQTSVGAGVLQIFVMEAVLGAVSVEGNRWTKPDRVSKSLHLEEGAPIATGQLLEDINWLNTNPGRQISASLKPGANVGLSDVVLTIDENRPYRVFAGIENTGPRFTGAERFFVGGNWYNAFGLDHRLSYQYTSDVELQFLRAHSASYEIPLPWRHTLTVFGGFADAESDFPTGGVVQEGSSWQTSLRYNMPLPKIRTYAHDLSLGFDYKQFNNDLEFGGLTVFATDVNVSQFNAQYRGSLADRFGATSAGVTGVFSPGDLLGDNNDDASFALARAGSKAEYMYGRAHFERQTKLPMRFAWRLRAQGQIADGNLQSSEQLGLGGYSTIRGYDEREANGDAGFIVSNEIHFPPFSPGKLLDPEAMDRAVFLAFYDYGQVEPHDIPPTVAGQDPHVIMESVGMGFRYSISKNLSLRFDYGWQLRNSGILTGPGGPRPNSSRGHVSATLSF